MMRVQVEEKRSLTSCKIVGGGRSSSVDILASTLGLLLLSGGLGGGGGLPSNSYRLGHLQSGNQCFPIYRRDFVNTQPRPDEDESWGEFLAV